jgi:predicted nuclease with TOPRIM domain
LPCNSLEAETDSLETETDSLEAETDSLETETDSFEAETDSLETETDSFEAETDSLETETDSLMFMHDPDPKLLSKLDPKPNKIMPDPQHCFLHYPKPFLKRRKIRLCVEFSSRKYHT